MCLRPYIATLIIAAACAPDDADLYERKITLVIERDELEDFMAPERGEPGSREPRDGEPNDGEPNDGEPGSRVADTPRESQRASEPASARGNRAGKRKKVTPRGPRISYSELLRHRNRMKALMYSVGLLPGDVPAIDRKMTQVDRLMGEGEYELAQESIVEISNRLRRFRLTSQLVNSKLSRARRIAGPKDKGELATIAQLTQTGKLAQANERLNRVLGRAK